MAVATIGAASLGSVFEELCDQVTQSMEKNSKFKTLLGYFDCTLNSVKERIIQPVEEGHQIFPDEEIETMRVQLHEGVVLIIHKFSKFRCRDYFCMDNHTQELVDLDRYLRRLLEKLSMRDFSNVLELKRWMISINLKVHPMFDEMLEIMSGACKALETARVSFGTETVPEAREGGDGRPARLVFVTLLGAVKDIVYYKRRPVMFKSLFWDILHTLVYLEPLVEEFKEALDGPEEKLRNFKGLMVKGVKIVRESAGVGTKWKCYNKRKYECINNLLGLNHSLARLLCTMRWVKATEATEKEVLARRIIEELDSISRMNISF